MLFTLASISYKGTVSLYEKKAAMRMEVSRVFKLRMQIYLHFLNNFEVTVLYFVLNGTLGDYYRKAPKHCHSDNCMPS